MPDALSAHVARTLEGLKRAGGLEFKLDLAAAVIGSFSPPDWAASTDPEMGVVGS